MMKPSALLSTKWVPDHLTTLGIMLLDASFHMPASGRNPGAEYRKRHIAGARFFDIDAISDPGTDLPHMLPPAEEFAHNLLWLELDSFDPEGLRVIRDRASMPIASCESLFGRRQYRPYFEHRAIDVAVVDVSWNGLLESHKIAAMAEAYEINCAPHNFYGHLATLMSAHQCAVMPNFHIMEIEAEDVPWKDALVTHPPVIEKGELLVPGRPGWGADVNEDAVRAHPPRNDHA